MPDSSSLKITTPSDREILMTRVFNAPRQLVYEAYTQPALLQRWLLGPPGWQLETCEIDLQVAGRYRYEWRHEDGRLMGMGGVYQELAPPERIVATELFDEDWTGGEAVSTIELSEKDGKTMLANTISYSSREVRDGVLESGMERGVEASYQRLDAILEE